MRLVAVAEENDYQEGKVVKSLKPQVTGPAAERNTAAPKEIGGTL